MSRKRSPARLVVALSIAAALAIFLVYNALAGGRRAMVTPSELGGHDGRVALVGRVVGEGKGDAHAAGLRFRLAEIGGSASVPVLYKGSVPDLFAPRRHVVVEGRLKNGVFVAERDTLVTKCPSKYSKKS